jgi:hypothetical protein
VNFFGSNEFVGLFGNKNLIEKSVNILFLLIFITYVTYGTLLFQEEKYSSTFKDVTKITNVIFQPVL